MTLRMVGAYSIDVSDVLHELPQKLEEWGFEGVEVDDEGKVVSMEAPYRVTYDDNHAVLQAVIVNCEVEPGMVISFNHDVAQSLIGDWPYDKPELWSYLTRYGTIRMWPVVYTWDSASEEPVVI